MKRVIPFAAITMLAVAALAYLVSTPAPAPALTLNVPTAAPTPMIASSGNVAAATATATLTSPAASVLYCEGFDITSSGSTAALPVTVTMTGTGATQSWTYSSLAGVLAPNAVLSVRFPTPVKASAAGTNFVVSMPTLGAGNTNATIVVYGYYQLNP